MTVRPFIVHNLFVVAVGVAGAVSEFAVWAFKALTL
jgi:hypothetical protein